MQTHTHSAGDQEQRKEDAATPAGLQAEAHQHQFDERRNDEKKGTCAACTLQQGTQLLLSGEGHQRQPVHRDAQQQTGQRRPPAPVSQKLPPLKQRSPAQQQPAEAPPHHACQGT